ncbi:MAG TPA: hypothetical protein VFY23_14560 [Candidatus Limnocylindrales bacterium]|nr:hypothetical protein [Candidatus Limnocylindrales bacterium]
MTPDHDPSPAGRREHLARWVAARQACRDLLEAAGLGAGDEWPPAWHIPIPRTLAERDALAHLALLGNA